MLNIVSAGSQLAVEAAREVLCSGGNAFDGAIAAVFAAMVSEPMLTSPGGGGFLLAVPAEKPPTLFDFFVDVPGRTNRTDPDFFAIDVDFGSATQQFHIGKASAAVPGNIAGLIRVRERLGRLPLQALVEPAVRSARSGVLLSGMQAYVIRILSPILFNDPAGRRLFAPEGRPLGSGDLFRNPKLADFLEGLGRNPSADYFRRQLAAGMGDWIGDGGLLDRKDLIRYRVEEREPLAIPFAGYEVLLNPPPAQSGWLLVLTLSLLEECLEEADTPGLSDLAAAMDVTALARNERGLVGNRDILGKPLHQTADFQRYKKMFRNGGAGASACRSGAGSTTHISVIDSEGNAAAVTTSNGEGCGYLLTDLGFMLNNMLGEEDLHPDGFFEYPGGKRLPSMMAPTIIRKEGRPVLVTGSSGSNRIRSAIVQVVLNYLVRGMTLGQATDAPRIHLEGGLLSAEPGLPEAELQTLSSRFMLERWADRNLFFGGVNSATPTEGAADPRRDGASAVFFNL